MYTIVLPFKSILNVKCSCIGFKCAILSFCWSVLTAKNNSQFFFKKGPLRSFINSIKAQATTARDALNRDNCWKHAFHYKSIPEQISCMYFTRVRKYEGSSKGFRTFFNANKF